MSRSLSPLRYPGGKSSIMPLISRTINSSGMQRYGYVEPYAGGCGLALSLLYGGYVSEIHINDIDPGVWSFWLSVLDHTSDLVALIRDANVTVDEWQRQRRVIHEGDLSDPIKLGFATFFLNRTCRSGIIRGSGVIGGVDQAGTYKIGCRFNKEELINRITRIKKYRSRIHLTRIDAVDLITDFGNFSKKTLFYIDPPYYAKGSSLYMNAYGEDDHARVSAAVLSLGRPWIVTYDNVNPIKSLYLGRRQHSFDIQYSAQVKRMGNELLIISDEIVLPEDYIAESDIFALYSNAEKVSNVKNGLDSSSYSVTM